MAGVKLSFSRDTMLSRMQAADAAYDGRFITGVLSTGIYCLPSCRARKPLPHNVEFFDSPTTAQAAGLRPCLRCRPDAFYAGVYLEEERLYRVTALDTDTVRNADAFAQQAGLPAKQLSDTCLDRWPCYLLGLPHMSRRTNE